MESNYLFRFSVIAAMFFGAIYVLLPTILQEDPKARLAESASAYTSDVENKPISELKFDAPGGSPESYVDPLTARYALARADVARVFVENGQVVVKLKPTTRRDAVRSLASTLGERRLYGKSVLGEGELPADSEPDRKALSTGVAKFLDEIVTDEAQRREWMLRLPTAATVPPNPNAAALDLTLTVSKGAPTLSGPLPDTDPVAVVYLGDRLAGLVTADRFVEVCAPVALTTPEGGTETDFDCVPDAATLLATDPLPGTLVEVKQEESGPAVTGPKPENAAAKSRVPEWVVGLLPDTMMNLGLDLRGGVDITLQVDLPEAVLTQVSRDASFLKERGAREGLTLTEARADHTDPHILVTTDANLDDVKKFLRKQLPEYVYVFSDGTTHAFEMGDARQAEVQENAVEQVLETLRKRIDALGTKEPSITKRGGGAINVQLPSGQNAEVDLEQALEAIRTAAVLEFRMGVKDVNDDILEQNLRAAEHDAPPDVFADDALLNQWLWDQKRLDKDQILLWYYDEVLDGGKKKKVRRPVNLIEGQNPFVANNVVELTGNDIHDASVSYDQNNQPYVRLEFKPRGGTIFCDLSSAHVNEQFAIILDDELISAPVIRDRICGGIASIEMGSDEDPLKEANNLALVLRTGSLDAPVLIGNIRTVGSTLGADAIKAGVVATVIGSFLVFMFMAVWYRIPGLIADLALALNVLLAMATLAMFGASLTLPGICGIALTVGMAVDANIIIYERIREELKLGVNARKAVDVGFDRALSAILDGNLTTAIAGIVLFSYGTGPIKGFSVTLLIGIGTTLLTALFVSRTFLDLLTRSSTAKLRI